MIMFCFVCTCVCVCVRACVHASLPGMAGTGIFEVGGKGRPSSTPWKCDGVGRKDGGKGPGRVEGGRMPG